jgi:hypothetical protein
MEEAKTIAVADYRRALEGGPEICPSESTAEHNEHGEEYSDSDMCTPGMLDGNGKPVLTKAMMTTEHADRLRRQGRAGGTDTFSGDGVKMSDPAMLNQNETCQSDYSS